MAQSLSEVLLHVVFSTKGRARYIDAAVEPHLYGYIKGTCGHIKAFVHGIGGVEDHIHLLVSLPRTISQSELVERVKVGSSKWMKTQGPTYRGFSWQSGYGIFSVSPTHKQDVLGYIANQKAHHKGINYQDEYRRLSAINNVPLDERYAWD